MKNQLARAVSAAVMSAVLVVTIVTPVAAEEVEPAQVEVAPLVSPPVLAPESVTPAGDFSEVDAPETTVTKRLKRPSGEPKAQMKEGESSFDAATSVPVDFDEFSTTYRNQDGTKTTALTYVPQNVMVDGEWSTVSTRLEGDDDGWTVDAHGLAPKFSEDASDTNSFTVRREDYSLGFTLLHADDSRGERYVIPRSSVGADRLTYPEVFEGVDLAYDVDAGEVKETLVLASLPEVGATAWSWRISAPGLTPLKTEFGEIEFVDSSGEAVFFIPAPTMWDSSGLEGVREPAQAMVDTSLERVDGRWVLTLSAKRSWLADAHRVYPVFVDPTVRYGWDPSDIRSFKSDGYGPVNYVNIGNSRDGAPTSTGVPP